MLIASLFAIDKFIALKRLGSSILLCKSGISEHSLLPIAILLYSHLAESEPN